MASRATIWRANQLRYTHHGYCSHFAKTHQEVLPLLRCIRANRKRVMGIEPTYPAWKAGVLPLNYTRISIGVTGFEPATSWSQTRRSSQAEPHPVFLFPCRYLRDTNSIIHKPPLYVNNFFKLFSKKFFKASSIRRKARKIGLSRLIEFISLHSFKLYFRLFSFF